MPPSIENMVHTCNELLAALKLKRRKQFSKRLKELERYIDDELELARDFGENTMTPVFAHIKQQIAEIKSNLEKQEVIVISILQTLEGIKDQKAVRDNIIKTVMHPIFKKWGYKKRARAFSKKERNTTKKVNIYTSRTSSYYELTFTFEVDIISPDINIIAKRPEQKWFELNQNTNLETIKAEVQAFLINIVKPFLDQY